MQSEGTCETEKWWIYITNTKDLKTFRTAGTSQHTVLIHTNTVTYGIWTQITYIMYHFLDKWGCLLTSKFVLAFFSTSRVLDTANKSKKDTFMLLLQHYKSTETIVLHATHINMQMKIVIWTPFHVCFGDLGMKKLTSVFKFVSQIWGQ